MENGSVTTALSQTKITILFSSMKDLNVYQKNFQNGTNC